MIYVYIKKELENFEADIRDLCLAFFSLEKITYVHDEDEHKVSNNTIDVDKKENNLLNIYVKDYFRGSLIGDRIKVKNELKRQLYNYLKKITGKELLWGTLTGIRPVTIVTKLLEEKYDCKKTNDNAAINNFKEQLTDELKSEYYISGLKAKELIDIAFKEENILDEPLICEYKDKYSVYIGVPFCRSTCLYCSFTSYNIDKYSSYVDDYLKALDRQISTFKAAHKNIMPLTIYIGGGTPTSLSNVDFDKMLTIIDKHIDKDFLIEYTVEAGRPDTITKEKLLSMKKHGVTRISINPQSFNQKTLNLIGRKHSVRDVKGKFKLARSLGFDNINMDIILGLPNEHLIDVLHTLWEVYKLKPESLTVHSLALKRAARLNYELDSWTKNYYLAGLENRRRKEKGKTLIAEGKREIDKMFSLSKCFANLLGLKPYYLYRQKNMAGNLENVGYTKEGKECVYNIMMMSERHSVYGFGTATTKEIFYEKNNDGSINKRVEGTEGYKSIIDYCKCYMK